MSKYLAWALLLLIAIGGHEQATSAPEDGQVLVFGGTGRLGSEVVRALLADGHTVTVFARPTSSRARLDDLTVNYVIGDVLDEASVADAFNVARFAVAVDALGRGSAKPDFYRISAKHIATHAARTGVKQIILHGSVGAGNSAEIFPAIDASSSMGQVMMAKSIAEQFVTDSGLSYTIIRNGQLISYRKKPTGKAELYEDHRLFGPVTREGLARLTTECLLAPRCHNKIYHAVDKSLM